MNPSLLAVMLQILQPSAGLLPGSQSFEGLSLDRWKLTLPVNTDWKGVPDEVMPGDLVTFRMPDVFFTTPSGSLMLKARCDGIPTKGSKYARCELREMNAAGDDEAAWSTADRQPHLLQTVMVIHELPVAKPHVVCAQIHDSTADVLMIRLEKSKLFVERERQPDVMLDRNYRLGQPFRLKIEAAHGTVQIWYCDQLKLKWQTQRSGCYFKAGCYTQSNVERGDRPDAAGVVEIQSLHLE